MRTALILSLAALAALTGCTASPAPARTRLTGGESRLISESLDRRATETRLTIQAESAPTPPPPTYIIRVTPGE